MLRQRVITAVVALLALVILLYAVPVTATRVVIASLMFLAAWEWGGLLGLAGPGRRMVYVALVAAIGAVVFFSSPVGNEPQGLFAIGVVWWLAALVWLFFHPTPIPTAIGWICGVLIIVPAWVAIDWLLRRETELLLVLLLIVWTADIGAYFAGRRFGRLKLAPAISPGKTWEGVIGGMAAVLVLALVIGRLRGGELLTVIPLFFAVATLSIVGDLTVSVFKRRAGVKDSGRLFPGHGGVLDRIDSLTAAAPLFALGSRWTGFSG